MSKAGVINCKSSFELDGKSYEYYSLSILSDQLGDISRLPYSLKVIVENILRHSESNEYALEHLQAIKSWLASGTEKKEIFYKPARVLMQDFTGVPAVVDLAAMRDAAVDFGFDANKINPLTPVDLVIDHSVMVDKFANKEALKINTEIEFLRNKERYSFLRWGQKALKNFRVVPPGKGICHQINLEYLSQVVWVSKEGDRTILYPDTLVGTDSHTTMVNGLAVLGWGVGGIEAEAAMLGQPISMRIPEVIGVNLKGDMPEGSTSTDLVLTITETLRKFGVVGKFVEFFGPGLVNLSLADRATISNMAPEYGATCGFFPADEETLSYLLASGRDINHVKMVKKYLKLQGMWKDENLQFPVFSETLDINMSQINPSLAGPKRPQDRVDLAKVSQIVKTNLSKQKKLSESQNFPIKNGDVVIAAITSCTNTSNPSIMIAAGLLAKKAIEKGLKTKPWVKTSLAPGSQVVADYLKASNLLEPLEKLGFHIVGYGCTTCIGNSGPIEESISKAIRKGDLDVAAVLSGNRNFEGRISPLIKSNWLASPPLVVAYALMGTTKHDITAQPIGLDDKNMPVMLSDVWPSSKEIQETIKTSLSASLFKSRYSNIFKGSNYWEDISVGDSLNYPWSPSSTYVRSPPYFVSMKEDLDPLEDILNARALLILGDSITTDHISPAGAIKSDGSAGKYLLDRQIPETDFNSYGARRGNHEIMLRGTFSNIRIKNKLVPGTEGGITKYFPSEDIMSVYEASELYAEEKTPLVVIAGKEYGTGSSRDWAAKGTKLLGVQAVIAESYERIHRSNLIGVGILPFEFKNDINANTLKLDGTETYSITDLNTRLRPSAEMTLTILRSNNKLEEIPVLCRIDTMMELNYYKHGGVLQYVLRKISKS